MEHHHARTARIWGGILLLVVGVIVLLKRLNVEIPHWLYTWEMLVIGIGFYVGVQQKFKGFFWMLLMAGGGVFLIDNFYPETNLKPIIWPVIIILFGIWFLIGPSWAGKKKCGPCGNETVTEGNEETISSVCVFGGQKKKILSKNFKGGEIVAVFGGAEIDLTHADIQGEVIIELVQVFGGTKLLVPATWDVKPEMVTVMGGVDDKRKINESQIKDANKTLVLKGTTVFGGLEIKSY